MIIGWLLNIRSIYSDEIVSLSDEAFKPVQSPAGAYPVIHGVSPKKKRNALMSNVQDELLGLWSRYNAGWYTASAIPERLKLKEVIDDQGRRLFEMVQEMDN